MSKKPKVAILTGAGVSAESGVKTFRDDNGLWEGHDVMEVASIDGWHRNNEVVLEFYNQRRRQLKEVEPNAAHFSIADLQKDFEVVVITQNVDDLHERAGSKNVIHLHGELRKVRSTADETLVYHWEEDCNIGDQCEKKSQLRPHIVWFGEAVPAMEIAIQSIADADVVVIVGTSMQVYPAAGLFHYAPDEAPVFYVDPFPATGTELDRRPNSCIIAKTATEGMPMVVDVIRGMF